MMTVTAPLIFGWLIIVSGELEKLKGKIKEVDIDILRSNRLISSQSETRLRYSLWQKCPTRLPRSRPAKTDQASLHSHMNASRFFKHRPAQSTRLQKKPFYQLDGIQGAECSPSAQLILLRDGVPGKNLVHVNNEPRFHLCLKLRLLVQDKRVFYQYFVNSWVNYLRSFPTTISYFILP